MDVDKTAEKTAGPLATWYREAGVRSGPRRYFADETDQGRVFFPATLVPYLTHDAVRVLPPERLRELTIRHLYQFLFSTAHLETRVVNRGAELIANNRVGFDVPMAHRIDAFKVYCDEGYHSLYSLDLANQVAGATQVAIPEWGYGGLVDRLDATAAALVPDNPELARLMQVVVFETLITAVLNEVPADPTVITAIRQITRDHARDEGRHHRFFSAFFHQLWPSLDAAVRVTLAVALPALVRGCLAWDLEPVRSSLVLAGIDPPTAAAVISDCYGVDAGNARMRDMARTTVKLFQSAGVLDVAGAAEQFAAHGLEVT
ncbi:MAG TPA: diiron oxygenase [Mycobacteriales bacterium]|nr:diiron oxygenase [Mycobacteriales bacterium]